MKKNYIKPNMEVIILKKQNMILMASAQESVDVRGVYEEGEYDDL